jgi:hypothetical protein
VIEIVETHTFHDDPTIAEPIRDRSHDLSFDRHLLKSRRRGL